MAHAWSTSITLCAESWYRDLEDMVPDAKTVVGNSAEQQWELHHRLGHITKWPDCPTCQKEAGARVVHRHLADMGLGHSNK
eukprot:5971277-Amphidinium_carterae.1